MGKIYFNDLLGSQSLVRGKTRAVQSVGVGKNFSKTSELSQWVTIALIIIVIVW